MSDSINKYKKILFFLCAFAFLFWLIALSGCNGYVRIAKNPPKSVKDTTRLATRFLKTFPPTSGVIKEGKIIILPDSNEYWKNIAILARDKKDSVVIKLKTKYVDTCLSVFDKFEEGSKLGYKIGLAKGKSECPQSTIRIDTFTQDKPQTTAQLHLVTTNLGDTTKELYRIRANYNELHSDVRSFKWSILHLFSFVQMWLILIVTGVIIFRNPLMILWRKLKLFRV